MPVMEDDFQAFVTNLGKYNEGKLVGEWVKFPTTEEEIQKSCKQKSIAEMKKVPQNLRD